MASDRVTFIGHSSLLMDVAGKKVVTDPWYNEPVYGGIYHRRAPGIPLEKLADVDVVLISHAHKDHYDEKALAQLDKEALVIVPDDKLARRVRGLGYSKVEMLRPWHKNTELTALRLRHDGLFTAEKLPSWPKKTAGWLTVVAVPAQHPVYQVGYVIIGEVRTFYFAGDTRTVPDFSTVLEEFKLDVALLPIAGLKMLFFRAVMGPEDAAKAAKALGAKVVIPIHYDMTIKALARLMVTQTSGSVDKLREAMKKEGCAAELVVLNEGETYPSS